MHGELSAVPLIAISKEGLNKVREKNAPVRAGILRIDTAMRAALARRQGDSKNVFKRHNGLNGHDHDYTRMTLGSQADFYGLRPCNRRLRMTNVMTGPEIAYAKNNANSMI
jgi:hypothetical protein